MTKWTRQEFIDAVWAVYKDYCALAAQHDRVASFRLPDYEETLTHITEHGMPAREQGDTLADHNHAEQETIINETQATNP